MADSEQELRDLCGVKLISHKKMNNFSEDDIRRITEGKTVSPDTPVRLITIGVPRIEIREGLAYQLCKVTMGEIEKEIFFSVDEKYADYLCHERGDAYLIGLLNFAMRERCNIHSEVPLTAELVHQLQTELIPPVVQYSKNLYFPTITGELTDEPLPSAQKTATGCSCGIDSLTAIKRMSEELGGLYKPDYLVINNVGAYGHHGKITEARYTQNVHNAQRFATALGVELIITNSNFAEVFPQNHYLTHIYSSSYAIFMLRKLWHRYYYASAGTSVEGRLNLKENEIHPPSYYDLIALPAFSISQLRVCNESALVSRFEKTRYLVDYPLAHKYLNVCLRQGEGNCGHCPKCTRTLWALDALGKLDAFSEILPISEYKAKRRSYLKELYKAHIDGASMIDEAYAILSKEIPLRTKLMVRLKRKCRNSLCWKLLQTIIRKVRRG